MNSGNSKIPDPHRVLLYLLDKIKLKRSDKYVALSNLSIYYTWKNIKKSCKNNKFKMSAPTWNEEYELPDGSYSVSNIQVYFEYILKKHERVAYNPSIRIYGNKMKNRITFRIKTEYYLEPLTSETMKLLGSTKSKITKAKNGENIPDLEIAEVVLIHCNIVNNDYHKDSTVLPTFVPDKAFGQLSDISPKNFTSLKTFDSHILSGFSYIEVWFTDQNSKLLEDKTKITLVIN